MHVEYLEKKLSVTTTPDLIDLIQKRINSLSSKRVSLQMGHDIVSDFPSAIEVSDKFFRSLPRILRNGIFVVDNPDDFPFLNLEKGKILGSASISCSYITALSCVKNILSIGHVLLRD